MSDENPMHQFRTHTGEIVTGDRLQEALRAVGDWYEQNAYAVRRENLYASHVAEATKEARLAEGIAFAASVRAGREYNFSVWQRLNTHLTGECVALLAK